MPATKTARARAKKRKKPSRLGLLTVGDLRDMLGDIRHFPDDAPVRVRMPSPFKECAAISGYVLVEESGPHAVVFIAEAAQ